jgi:hypothetical protein
LSTIPGMPRSIAAGIVDVVAQDAECRKLIPVVSGWSVGQRAAGSLRNFTNMTAQALAWVGSKTSAGEYARDYWERKGDEQACDKIAVATANAISEGIRRGKLPKWVSRSFDVSRKPLPDNQVAAYHSATGVEVGHGRVYVFDWHGPLTLRCPLISRSLAEWERGDDRYRVLFSNFQGWD